MTSRWFPTSRFNTFFCFTRSSIAAVISDFSGSAAMARLSGNSDIHPVISPPLSSLMYAFIRSVAIFWTITCGYETHQDSRCIFFSLFRSTRQQLSQESWIGPRLWRAARVQLDTLWSWAYVSGDCLNYGPDSELTHFLDFDVWAAKADSIYARTSLKPLLRSFSS